MGAISDYEFQNLLRDALNRGDPDKMSKVFEVMQKQRELEIAQPQLFPQPYVEPQKLSWEKDEYRNKKTVTINVQIMVENLLGGHDPNRDVHVRLEKYGDQFHQDVAYDNLAFVVVNICDIKTGNIITLRETYGKFPSPEFLTKLELLRVGKADVVV